MPAKRRKRKGEERGGEEGRKMRADILEKDKQGKRGRRKGRKLRDSLGRDGKGRKEGN